MNATRSADPSPNRRSIFTLIVTCLATFLICLSTFLASAAAVQTPVSSKATMFRGGPAHSGRYPGRTLDGFGGLAWRLQTEGTVRSTPAILGSTVYVGSGDGRLYAIDRANGTPRWTFDAGSAITSSPAIADGIVFFGTHDDDFYALAVDDGNLIWHLETGPALPFPWGYESGDVYTSSPTVVGETVLFGSGDGRVYAVEARTGTVLWKYRTEGRVRSSPAVVDGAVYVGSADGSIYAIELDTGRLRWRFDTEGRDLFSGDFGYDRRTVQSSPAVVDGVVYVGARDGYLYAIDAASGRRRWSFNHEISWVNSSPAVSGGIVYAGSSDGRFIHAVDVDTGEEIWRLETPSIVWSSPAIVAGMLYVGDGAGLIHAVDRLSGERRWSYRVGNRILSSPVPSNGILYFGSDDGGVYALRGGDEPILRRAVFWDEDLRDVVRFEGPAVRDYLESRGYRVLDSTALAEFLEGRLADGAPSVVVFAMDRVPARVAPVASDTVLFRRYLDAGGKVVWLDWPPHLWRLDPERESASLRDIDRNAPRALLGVSHEPGNFDAYGARPTEAGRRWGLDGWWLARWSVDPATVTRVLATNERGDAAAWHKSYGGPPGTGFVRIPGELWRGRRMLSSDLIAIQTAAEYMPLRP